MDIMSLAAGPVSWNRVAGLGTSGLHVAKGLKFMFTNQTVMALFLPDTRYGMDML